MKNLFFKISVLTIALASITACQTQRAFTSSKAESEYKSGSRHAGRSNFFVSGIGQTDRIDAVKICGKEENIQAVETKMTFLNGFVGLVTFGIYTPREYSVYCK